MKDFEDGKTESREAALREAALREAALRADALREAALRADALRAAHEQASALRWAELAALRAAYEVNNDNDTDTRRVQL